MTTLNITQQNLPLTSFRLVKVHNKSEFARLYYLKVISRTGATTGKPRISNEQAMMYTIQNSLTKITKIIIIPRRTRLFL